MKLARFVLSLFVLLLVLSPAASAQGVTGQISGTVTDPADAVVPGAVVQLTHVLSQQSRQFVTRENGAFVFTNLVPGEYAVHVAQPGFKAYEQKGIIVAAQERVDLHEVKLQVGDVSTSMEVQAEAVHVQTDSSDRHVNITTSMIQDVPVPGRDILGAIRILPGSQSIDPSSGLSASFGQSGGLNGGLSGQMVVQLDGIVSQDSGFPSTTTRGKINADSVSEMQVMVSNYNAEYGSRAGGTLTMVTKNGTNQFHGTAYYFWRHEQFNANEFFSNKTGAAKALYRFQNPGGTIGGPVLLPFTNFNRDRTKMFFFYSEDDLYNKGSSAVNRTNMPTALERTGDFSQTVTSTGVPIPIRDPLQTGNVPFPGNIIPTSRISPQGRAYMNLFPLPNTVDASGQRQFNAQFQFPTSSKTPARALRVDYNISPKTISYVRLLYSHSESQGVGVGVNSGSGLWGQFVNTSGTPFRGFVVTVIRTIRPNLISESTVGTNFAHQQNLPADPVEYNAKNSLANFKDPLTGQAVGVTQVFSSNISNLIPTVNFGTRNAQSPGQSITNPPAYGWDGRWPFDGTDSNSNYTTNLTWVKGRHNAKFGFNLERVSRNVSTSGVFSSIPQYFVGTDSTNPNDTGYPYSNLLSGSVQAYGQDNNSLVNHARYFQYEWFAQDTWKVSRRFTVDIGVRWQLMPPTYSHNATLGLFSASKYNAANAGQLLFPYCTTAVNAAGSCPAANRVAINPKTGVQFPFARRAFFDPSSYPSNGYPWTGIQYFQDKVFNTPPVLWGPRVGFAYDVFGDGKMAIRGGFGMFYERPFGVDTIGGLLRNPPSFLAPTFFNTTFSTLQQAQAFYGPQTLNGGSTDYKTPSTYNWSLGIQRDLTHGIILDVSYVANVAHNRWGGPISGSSVYNMNAIAPLTTWTPTGGVNGTLNPAFADPTNKTALLDTNLIRALIGYAGLGDINTFTSAGASNYNSLQVQVNRRFGRSLQFSSNYTFQKTLSYSRQQWVSDQITKNVSLRKHAVNLNLGWTVPDGSRKWKNVVTQAALDGWHISAVGSLFSGLPLTPTCTAQSAPVGWPNGTPTGGIPLRCQMTGDLWLPDGTTPATAFANKATGSPTADTRLWYPIDGSHFVLPSGTTLGLGNTPPTLFWGPGFENLDLGLFKSFRVREQQSIEFRVEMFNALNHFNPAEPNVAQTINFATGANTNADFGSITAAAGNSRRMAVSLKYRF